MTAVRDPGLQPERTRLAWRRTMLAVTVVTILAVRLGLTGGRVGALLTALAILGWGAMITLCWRRAVGSGVPDPSVRTLSAVGLCVAGLALIGVVLVVCGV